MASLVDELGEPVGGELDFRTLQQPLDGRVEEILTSLSGLRSSLDDLLDRGESRPAEVLFDEIDGWLVPAGVHHPDLTEVKPQRQRAEPLEIMLPLCTCQLLQECLVLFAVLTGVRAEEPTWTRWIRERVGDRIELVIAQDDLSRTGIDHPLDDLEHLKLLGSPVDQIAEEDRLSIGMSEDLRLLVLDVAEVLEDLTELGSVPVDVTDDVVPAHGVIVPKGCRTSGGARSHPCDRGESTEAAVLLKYLDCWRLEERFAILSRCLISSPQKRSSQSSVVCSARPSTPALTAERTSRMSTTWTWPLGHLTRSARSLAWSP
jgi:hypothetical protein